MPSQRKGTPDQIEIGEHIRSARKELNLSQEALAEKVGIEKNTVYRYETGRGGNMSVDIFLKFAEVLGKTPTELAPSRFLKADPNALQVVYDIYQQYGKEDCARLAQTLNRFAQKLKSLTGERK